MGSCLCTEASSAESKITATPANTPVKSAIMHSTDAPVKSAIMQSTDAPLQTSDILTHLTTSNAAPTWANTIPFVPPITRGVVIKVYDGDTITIAARLPYPDSPLYRFAVRLSGIDSPEIRGKSPEEKAAAVVARDALSAQVLGRVVELRNTGCEKYGRLLADVYLPEASSSAAAHGPQTSLHINSWMLENSYAVPYDGGKKEDFIPST